MTLVLGVTQPQNLAAIPVQSAAYRDAQRVTNLKHVLSSDLSPVYTIDTNASGPQKPTHYDIGISNRGARKFNRLLPNGFQFRIICGDYFRFPTAYFRQAYREIIPFLKILREQNRLHQSVRIYLPIIRVQPPFNMDEFRRQGFAIKMIQNDENPLYYATNNVQTRSLLQHQDETRQLAGYNNDGEMRNFRGFAVVSLQPNPPPWQPDVKLPTRCKMNCKMIRCGAINKKGEHCCLCTRHPTGLCHHHR
jgi:hypothetical protein